MQNMDFDRMRHFATFCDILRHYAALCDSRICRKMSRTCLGGGPHETREKRSGDTLVRPNVNKVNKGDRSLNSFGPIVWNTMLPEELKSCTNLATFKHSIKSWKPDNCLCFMQNICKRFGICQTF